jgi:L-fuconolactonase
MTMPGDYIDAHHHLWKYSREQYPWMVDGMDAIRRDFLLDDLRSVLWESGIDGAVTVQARQTIKETEWLLTEARRSQLIRGVVGWVPLCDPGVGGYLERFFHC